MIDPKEFKEDAEVTTNELEDFRDGEGEPIQIEDLKRRDLENIPKDAHISVFDDSFPETSIWRKGEFSVCEIQERLYTKYWEHKFSAYAFAEAME